MKTKNRSYKTIIGVLLGLILINTACTVDRGEGWNDERYTTDFDFYIYHTNPLTGVDYTEEELAELTYDPKTKENYAEGQMVELTLVSAKMPREVKVLSGVDFDVLATITNFTQQGEGYVSESFSSSLENLNLLEIGDKTSLKFDIVFEDESIGAANFDIQRVKFFDPNAIIDTFVFLAKSTGETIPLRIDENVTSRVKDGAYGSIVELDGATNKVEVVSADIGFRGAEDFSIGIWVNTTATNSDPSIIGDKDWGSGSNPGFVFAFVGDSWKLNAGDGGNRIDIDGDIINDGNWHYLVATFDKDGSAVIYQDGTSLGSADISGFGDMTSNFPIFVGQDGTGNYGDWFQGNVGSATIYDYALTAEQVAGISSPSLGAQLKTQAGVTTNLNVTSAGAVLSNENDRTTLQFDGTDDLSTLENGANLDFRKTGDFSITAWVQTTSGISDPSIIGDKDWGSGGNPGFVLAFTGGTWKLNAGDGSNRVDVNGGNINDGEWHFIAVTFDRDGDATVYQDGNSTGSADMSALGSMDSGLPIRLAQDGTGSYGDWFEGKVAETVIYDYVLTAEQIKSLFDNE